MKEKTENYNSITKKIKIAYKRWDKTCKAEGEKYFSDKLMTSGIYIVSVSKHRAKQPNLTMKELILVVQKEQDETFEKQQEKKLKDAEKFALLQKLSEQETIELINNIKAKIAKEKCEYKKIKTFSLGLFDYKEANDSIVEDYDKPREIIKILTDLGYHAFLIDNIKIINSVKKDLRLISRHLLDSNYDIVVNGTFFIQAPKSGSSPVVPVGTVITKEGEIYETDHYKAVNRGGFATLKSGMTNYKLCNGDSVESILPLFEDQAIVSEIELREIYEKDEVDEFIGGGCLLIDNNRLVTGKELAEIQLFNQAFIKKDKDGKIMPQPPVTNGFKCAQTYKTRHILLAKHNELDYIIAPNFAKGKSCEKIQTEISQLGFSHLIKFDGGRAFFVHSKIANFQLTTTKEYLPSGFAIKTIKL